MPCRKSTSTMMDFPVVEFPLEAFVAVVESIVNLCCNRAKG